MLICSLGTARGDWQLGWSDEFDGSAINTNNRTFDIGNGSGGWGHAAIHEAPDHIKIGMRIHA
jgi:beta-glucanase (GH16 family)